MTTEYKSKMSPDWAALRAIWFCEFAEGLFGGLGIGLGILIGLLAGIGLGALIYYLVKWIRAIFW